MGKEYKFADRLKEARLAKGLTEQEVADKLHVTRQAVNNWERGINYPDIELIPKIAELLDMDIGFLLSGEERSPEIKYVEKPVFYKKKYKNQKQMTRAIRAYKASGKSMRILCPIVFFAGLALAIVVICINLTNKPIGNGDLKTQTEAFSIIAAIYFVVSIIFGIAGHFFVKKYTAALKEIEEDEDDNKSEYGDNNEGMKTDAEGIEVSEEESDNG